MVDVTETDEREVAPSVRQARRSRSVHQLSRQLAAVRVVGDGVEHPPQHYEAGVDDAVAAGDAARR